MKTIDLKIASATALVLMALAATAGARELTPRLSFDNRYIPAGHPGSRYLEIDLEGPWDDDCRSADRPELNLILVIDRSGSMAAAGKIEYVKETAMDIVSRLDGRDTFALVTYNDYAQVVVPATRVHEPEEFQSAIGRVWPGGSTNLGAGLETAYAETRRHFRPGAVNRVMLLTDGLANRGVTDPGLLADLAARESADGISLSTFGVGLEYNEDLLTNLADAGRGAYWYIASPSQIPDVLAREFGQASRAAWLDVTITLRLRPCCGFEGIYGYPFRREGDRVIIHLGDLAAGARRRVMAQVRHSAMSRGRQEVGDVEVSYRRPGTGGEGRSAGKLVLEATESESSIRSGADKEVQKRAAMAVSTEGMAAAARLADQRKFSEAREALKAAAKVLDASPVKDADVQSTQRKLKDYEGGLSGAKSMAPQEMNRMQKEKKFEIYQMQRSGR